MTQDEPIAKPKNEITGGTRKLPPSIQFTNSGLTFAATTSFEEWKEGMEFLKVAHDHYQAVLGDAIRFGEETFGKDEVAEVCVQLELNLSDVNKGRTVAMLPPHKREEFSTLTNDHFYVVNSLIYMEEERIEWLENAVNHKLSIAELKDSIDKGHVVKHQVNADTAGKNSGGILTIEAIMFNFQQWERNVSESLGSWKVDQMKQFLDVTEPVAKLRDKFSAELDNEID